MSTAERSNAQKLVWSAAAVVLLVVAFFGGKFVRPTIVVRSSVAPWPRDSREFREGYLDGLKNAKSEFPFFPVQPTDAVASFSYDSTRRFVDGRVLPRGAPYRASHPGLASGRWRSYLHGMRWVLDRRVDASHRAAVRRALERARPTMSELSSLIHGSPKRPSSPWRFIDISEQRARIPAGEFSGAFSVDLDQDGVCVARLDFEVMIGEMWISIEPSSDGAGLRGLLEHRVRQPFRLFHDGERIALYEDENDHWSVIHLPSMTLLLDTRLEQD